MSAYKIRAFDIVSNRYQLAATASAHTKKSQGWKFNLSIFLIFKKDRFDIFQDRIDRSITKNDWLDREKKGFFVCFLTVFPPFYAKRSNRSRRSSIFFKDRHYRFPLVDLSICRSQKGSIRSKNRLSYSQHWNFQKAMYHLRLSLGWMGRTFLRLSKALACSKVRSWTEH